MQTAVVVYNVAQAEYIQELAPCTLIAPGQPVPAGVERVVLTRGCRSLDPLYSSFPLIALESAVGAVMKAAKVRGKHMDMEQRVSAYAYLAGKRFNFDTHPSLPREYRCGKCLAIDERQRWLAFERAGTTCICFDPSDCPALLEQLLQ